MKYNPYVKKLIALSLPLSLSAFLIACSTQSGSFEQNPKVSIPDLPPGVRYTEPKLPAKAAGNAAETAVVLQEYENANIRNRNAINQARKHNKNLQKTYNTPAVKEEDKSWFKNPLTGDFKLW